MKSITTYSKKVINQQYNLQKMKGQFNTIHLYLLLGMVWIIGCKNNKNMNTPSSTNQTFVTKIGQYGFTHDSQAVDLYKLTNTNGMEINVITYGGIITSWKVKDKNNVLRNVVLGYDSLSQYIRTNPYFGAIIGRYGNRIAQGKFTLEGKTYQLATNDGQNHLHGGIKGFDKVIWTANISQTDTTSSLVLTYLSKDMEEGYPGNLNIKVTYTITSDDMLEISYEATTDKTTIVNLTQHTYFNLSGDFNQTILDHELSILADHYLPVNTTLIPTGVQQDVKDTPFDFTQSKTIGKDIEMTDEQLKNGLGYDHCWVLRDQGKYRLVSTAFHPSSGRLLEVFSDEPGIQFYSGNFLDGTLPMSGGIGTYAKRTGFCLETQHFPDAPNQPSFPSVTLKVGDVYKSHTAFKFSIK